MLEALNSWFSESSFFEMVVSVASLALGIFFVGSMFKEMVIDEIASLLYRQKCYHGVWHGNTMKNGKMRCPQCQATHDEDIKKEQLRTEYQKRFTRDLVIAIKKRKRALIADEKTIHEMSPNSFEDMVATLFRELGYKVQQTPYTNDGGKDAIIYKDGKKYLVECKRYKSDASISRPLMQKLFAAMVEENADGGFFVASCRYTQEALEYGKKFGITTINLSQLLDLISKTNCASVESSNYDISCKQCGKLVSFGVWEDIESKECPNKHIVPNIFFDKSGYEPICLECGSKLRKTKTSWGDYYSCLKSGHIITVQKYEDRINEIYGDIKK